MQKKEVLSVLDRVFQNPVPNYVVQQSLLRLYCNAVIAKAQEEGWDEREIADRLQNFAKYHVFLQELNAIVAEEIESVGKQLYGKNSEME
jgi:hypothetical protein